MIFPDFESGVACMHEIAMKKCAPVSIRLVDNLQFQFGQALKPEVKNMMKHLMDKAKNFFKKNGLLLNWKEFEKLDQPQKINTLAMIAPVTNEEKQKLLEAITTADKINVLENIISFYMYETGSNNQTIQ